MSTTGTPDAPPVLRNAADLQAKIKTTLVACLEFLEDKGMALVQTEKSAEVVFEDEVEDRPTINDCATLFGNPSCASVLLAVCLDHIADDLLHDAAQEASKSTVCTALPADWSCPSYDIVYQTLHGWQPAETD